MICKTQILSAIAGAVVLISACGGGGDIADDAPQFVSVSNGFYNSSIIFRDGQGMVTEEFRDQIDIDNNVIDRFTTVTDGDEFRVRRGTYNDRGYLIRDERFNAQGQLTRRRNYTHNSQGYLISYRIQDFDDDNSSRDVSHEFDAQNRLQRRVFRSLGGDIIYTFDFELDSRGLFSVRRATFFNDGQVDTRENRFYQYDNLDRIIAVDSDFNLDGAIDRREEFQYDAFGNVVLLTRLDGSGAVEQTRTYGYEQVNEPIFNRWIRSFRYFP
jgi:hypothetical protein